jgi:hypothetical protein
VEQNMTNAQRRRREYKAFWRARDAYQVQRFAEGLIGTFFLLELLRCGWLKGLALIAVQASILAAAWWGSKQFIYWIWHRGGSHDTGREGRTQGTEATREARHGRLALSQAEAVYREEQRTSRDKRWYRLGRLADEAGLSIWDDPTLRGLFGLLACLRTLPDPVAVLDGLMSDAVLQTGTAATAGTSLLAFPGGSDSSAVSRNGEGHFLPDSART